VGIGIFITGVLVYFLPLSMPRGQELGFILAGFTVFANAIASILGRSVNRAKLTSPLVVTGVSMGIGAIILLVSGILVQGFPVISIKGWIIIVFLAVVNTAFAFTLWNRSLQVLSAVESSIINNTMLIQIALLAWIFLGEEITIRELVGLIMAMVGILMAQI
jgi:drug/metabolite transporter (DMT)-like permease